MSKITITVSGPVGVGKSAICAKLEILLKHLGADVEWVGGKEEANLTLEEWTAEYKVPIEIVEEVESTRKVYETYNVQSGWREVSQEEYDRTKHLNDHRIRRVSDTQKSRAIQELLPVGFMMKHQSGSDRGFSWKENDAQFSKEWQRIGLYSEDQIIVMLREADESYAELSKKWRESFDVMHRRTMSAERQIEESNAILDRVREAIKPQAGALNTPNIPVEAQERSYLQSEWQTGIPPTKEGEFKEYIVAVRRAHDPERVFVFSANYANKYDDELRDQDGKEFVANGWYHVGGDASGEFDNYFTPTLDKWDDVVGWQPLPKWHDA